MVEEGDLGGEQCDEVPVKKFESNLSNLIDQVISNVSAVDRPRKIVDIITFCEDPNYLNFLGQEPPLALWPMQRIVLKLFYRGTEGNEDLKLTDEEIGILKSIAAEEDLDYDLNLGGFNQVLDKYNRGEIFTHLLLVMGRRSSKTMMVSIIATYEAYKLCEAPEGNPQKKYGMTMDKPIHIMNMAVSEAQALDPLFVEIETRIARSTYFIDKINNAATIKGKIFILTDADKAENARRREAGVEVLIPGSVILLSGHSKSSSLRGHATICILFDEFAHFVSTTGVSSGDALYNAMTPSMRQFGRAGKVVMLSDPKGKDGMFWKLFTLAEKKVQKDDGTFMWPHDEYLVVQVPTWRMNPGRDFTKEVLHQTERPKDPVAFEGAYGARFVGSEGHRLFDPDKVQECIDFRAHEMPCGDPSFAYYIHLDPATTSHNYALSMVHSVTYTNSQRELKRRVFVDCLKYWRPTEGPVKLRDVEKYIRELCRRFRVAQVTFDSFQSAQTIQNLRESGIRAFETPYRISYITEIYGELKNLINEGDLILYPHEELIGELTCLQYRILNRGIKRYFDPKSDWPSDDLADSLAGAVFQSLHAAVIRSLPKSALAWTGRR